MKKLLVLLCVFALATVANAGLLDFSLETDGSTLYVVGLANGSVPTYTIVEGSTIDIEVPQDSGYPVIVLSPGNLGSNAYAAGDLAAITVGNAPPGDIAAITAGVGPATGDSVDAGDWFEISIATLSGSYTPGQAIETLQIYDSGLQNIGEKSVTYRIPEPMTIALLGLGGLFLRRRK